MCGQDSIPHTALKFHENLTRNIRKSFGLKNLFLIIKDKEKQACGPHKPLVPFAIKETPKECLSLKYRQVRKLSPSSAILSVNAPPPRNRLLTHSAHSAISVVQQTFYETDIRTHCWLQSTFD